MNYITHKDLNDEKWYFTDVFRKEVRNIPNVTYTYENLDGTLDVHIKAEYYPTITLTPLPEDRYGCHFEMKPASLTFKDGFNTFVYRECLNKVNAVMNALLDIYERVNSKKDYRMYEWKSKKGVVLCVTPEMIAEFLELPMCEETYSSIYNNSDQFEDLMKLNFEVVFDDFLEEKAKELE